MNPDYSSGDFYLNDLRVIDGYQHLQNSWPQTFKQPPKYNEFQNRTAGNGERSYHRPHIMTLGLTLEIPKHSFMTGVPTVQANQITNGKMIKILNY